MGSMLMRILSQRTPLRVVAARKAIQAFSLFSYEDRLKSCAVDRPHYGHCLYEAARLATRLDYPRVSAIEFGCGGGNGLLNAETHILELEKIFPVKFELYGSLVIAGFIAASAGPSSAILMIPVTIQFFEYTAILANPAFSLAEGTDFNQDWPISDSVLIKIVPPANQSRRHFGEPRFNAQECYGHETSGI